jgi:hypothetical protein
MKVDDHALANSLSYKDPVDNSTIEILLDQFWEQTARFWATVEKLLLGPQDEP